MKKSTIKAPSWLRPETKKWFLGVLDDFDLEESDVKLLTLAAEAFDRATQARETLAESGITPAVKRMRFARLLLHSLSLAGPSMSEGT